jgi:hypothetical protein
MMALFLAKLPSFFIPRMPVAQAAFALPQTSGLPKFLEFFLLLFSDIQL